MKQVSRISSLLSSISLTHRMLLTVLLVSVLVWAVLDNMQSRRLKNISDSQLTQLLNEQAMRDRIRFDNYVMAYHDMATFVVSQKRFHDYIRQGLKGSADKIKHYDEIPPWLPDSSMLRHFVKIHTALIIDGRGIVREVYQDIKGLSLPDSILSPSQNTLRLSRRQSLLTFVEGMPYLIVTEPVKGSSEGPEVELMLVSLLDDDFLSSSQGVLAANKGIIALIGPDNQRIIASNAPDLIPAGTTLKEISDRYLVASKAFFDWGGSEILMQFASLISRDELKNMSRSVMNEVRFQRGLISVLLFLSFSLLMYWITRRIKRLSDNISVYSRDVLQMPASGVMRKGNQLRILEDRFDLFKNEIEESREKLKKQAKELLREKTVYLDSLLHATSFAVIALDLDRQIKYFNPAAEKYFNISSKKAVGRTFTDLGLNEKLNLPDFERLINEDVQGNLYISGIDRDEQILESKVELITDTDNNINGLLLIIHDITERKQAEEKLKQFAETQAVLLREVNHRVKNNLAVIISMLHKEEDRLKKKGFTAYQAAFTDLHNRIESLLVVHNTLSSSEWQDVRISELCKNLISGLLNYRTEDIVTEITETDITVDSNQAHYLALLLNELITNSLKYAVAFSSHPEIKIAVSGDVGSIRIVFRDNGPGYPDAIIEGDYSLTGIGFDLINGIVRQSLNGNISFRNENGAVAEIVFREL